MSRTHLAPHVAALWPHTLPVMCTGNVTAERILDVWARVHGHRRVTRSPALFSLDCAQVRHGERAS